jgi:hypothetical protein
MNAIRVQGRSQSQMATSLQRLSSGLRVNSAKDDAAGLAISTRMDTQVRGMNQARPFFHAEELIKLVHFHPDLLLGLQRHDNKLTVSGRVKYPAKFFILDGNALDVLYKTIHGEFSR